MKSLTSCSRGFAKAGIARGFISVAITLHLHSPVLSRLLLISFRCSYKQTLMHFNTVDGVRMLSLFTFRWRAGIKKERKERQFHTWIIIVFLFLCPSAVRRRWVFSFSPFVIGRHLYLAIRDKYSERIKGKSVGNEESTVQKWLKTRTLYYLVDRFKLCNRINIATIIIIKVLFC